MTRWTRRQAMKAIGAAAVGTGIVRGRVAADGPDPVGQGGYAQAICRSCFGDTSLGTVLARIAELGVDAVDLLRPDEWAMARDHGLTCVTGYAGAGVPSCGLNDPSQHRRILRNLETHLPRAAALGVRQVVAFVGVRRGRSDAEGLDHCTSVLARAAPLAEQTGVTIAVELLNSRVDYPGYQGDRMSFGIDLVERVDSPRVKLLYDIYHMQIMEGDIIHTMREREPLIAHVHTGGVPGRQGLSRNQELNWSAICRALAASGYRGYVAHELAPIGDPMSTLAEALAVCTI